MVFPKTPFEKLKGKIQVIKFTNNHEESRAYVTYYKLRIYLDEVMRSDSQNPDYGTGVYTFTNNISFIVYIDPKGEFAKVIRSKETE